MAGSSVLLAPTAANKRIASIDILRGFAVLGILMMNIQSFSMPASAYMNPSSFENLTGIDLWVWATSHALADQKFMAIFTMLFGASIIMISRKARKEHLRSGDLQSRRFVWLLIIGLLHAYLLWYGDILVAYAICGFFMFIFRSKKHKSLVRLGVLFLLIGSGIRLLMGYSIPFWEPGQFEAFEAEIWRPTQNALSEEIDFYTSNWERQMIFRAPEAFNMQTIVFITTTFWRVSGLMLIGMGLQKRRVFAAKESKKFYLRLVTYGLIVGLPMVLAGIVINFHFDWDFKMSYFYVSQLNYWGSIAMALGYVGIVMLVAKISTTGFIAEKLANVGRLSLTNYLLQSIICTFVFYGHGLGMFGDLERSVQAFAVLIVWIFQIIFSSIWLNYFKYGPFEWIWRSLSYGKLQPISKFSS